MNTMSGPKQPADLMLSADASASLDRLLLQRRAEILNAVQNVSRQGRISDLDIMRAYVASTKPFEDRKLVRAHEQVLRAGRVGIKSGLLASAAALLTSSVALYLSSNHPNGQFVWLVSLAGALATLVSIGGLAVWIRALNRAKLAEHDREVFRAISSQVAGKAQTAQAELREAETVGLFLRRWQKTEARLRTLAVDTFSVESDSYLTRPIGTVVDRLVAAGVLERNIYVELRSVITIRNSIVHGRDTSREELRHALDRLDQLDKAIEHLTVV